MDHTQLIKDSFNNFNGSNNEVLNLLYDEHVVFEDPLTKVSGLAALKDYYQHAYKSVKSIHFDFKEIHVAGLVYTLEWDMSLSSSALNWGKPFTVRGASVLIFSEDSGKVIKHDDYVDVSSMVYEKIPGIGKVVELFKSKLS